VEPGERYSAGRFARDAVHWLNGIDAGRQPMVVGGTGLYVRALVDGLFREPPMDPVRRETLRQWTARAEHLAGWAARLDRQYTGGGRQRAARTVEVALLTGRPLSWWQREARAEGVMRPWYVRLTCPRAVLHARIRHRVERMLDAGLVEEVRQLLARGIPPGVPGLDGVGYPEVVAHLAGSLPVEGLVDAIAASTRRYAKRQETWFRHQLVGHSVITLDTSGAPAALADRIVDLWETRGG
jgi:tRNA dimethylallyltransferase